MKIYTETDFKLNIVEILNEGSSTVVFKTMPSPDDTNCYILKCSKRHRMTEVEYDMLKWINNNLPDLNVPKLKDMFGLDYDGKIYSCLLIEYIDGVSLEMLEIVNLNMVIKLADTLITIIDQLHQADIAHCDIKLENVILTPSGDYVLIDFGSSFRLNPHNYIMTTPGYLSAELIKNRQGNKDPDLASHQRGDWFALGMTLYLLVNTTDPFPVTDTTNHYYDFSKYIPSKLELACSGTETKTMAELNELIVTLLTRTINDRKDFVW